jgi:serine/threonine protein kinase/tetratricopeptide (TPR) repeat protein
VLGCRSGSLARGKPEVAHWIDPHAGNDVNPTSESLRLALADRYAIECELGRGGMATVYRARDVRHDRWVALKVLRRELAAMLGEERFTREIKLTARLRHPHILPVFDSGSTGSELWYVTPCIEGGSLREHLHGKGRLPVDDALGIARDMLSALAHAHAEGIVHRDIKPENVLLEGNEAIVADFGIARALHAAGTDALTETGLSLGTPAYMSPEQVTGDGTLDGRSDLYAVACVLYEMLTGQAPYAGPTAQAVLARKLVGAPPSARAVNPAIPPGLDACLARGLAVSPDERFATATAFAKALAAAQTAPSAPTEALASPLPSARRFVPYGVAAAIVVLAALGLLLARRPKGPAVVPSATRLAVLPFSVAAGADLGYLGPGMVDLLSRNLDGAGEVRTVDAGRMLTALRKAGVKPGDADQARAVAQRLGAGQVVQGNVSAAGARLRIQAELLEARGDSALLLSRAAAEGDSVDLFALVDRLAAELLAERPQGPGFRLLRTAAFTTRSLPALKAYLKAEQHFRAVQPDSAIAGFRHAVDDDSSFALAHYRLAVAALWGNRPAQIDSALDRALRLAARLPDRDRALVRALDAFRRGAPDSAEARYRAILRDYPDDLEASAELGLLLFNYQPLRGRPRVESGQIFHRVVELDPRFFCPI